MGARALLLLAALSLLAPAPARAFVVALSAPGPPPPAAAAAGAWRHRHLLPQRTMVPLRVPKRTFGVLLTSVAGPQNEDRRTVNSPAPGWRIPAAVAAVAVAAVLFARPLAAAALHPKADSGEAASVRARWARPAPTLLVAIPGRSEVAQAKDDSQQQAIGARRSVFSIAASLVVAAVGAIILGIPASVLLLASFALPDLSNAVRATLVLVALPFAAVKFLPRVSKLRFNLEEFAKVNCYSRKFLGLCAAAAAASASPPLLLLLSRLTSSPIRHLLLLLPSYGMPRAIFSSCSTFGGCSTRRSAETGVQVSVCARAAPFSCCCLQHLRRVECYSRRLGSYHAAHDPRARGQLAQGRSSVGELEQGAVGIKRRDPSARAGKSR